MKTGMFDLSILENAPADATVDLSINEGGEFIPNSNATSGAENGVSGTTVSVPGGDKESPSAKPEGGEQNVPVPGGLSEKPTAKGHSEVSVPTPQKVELDVSTYNAAITKLQQSFKEGVEVLDIIRRADVVEISKEQKQKEFTENAINEAMLMAYEDGPLFEAVDRSDKNAVKKIVRHIRTKIDTWMADNDISYYKPSRVLTILFDATKSSIMVWNTRLWQFIGVCHVEDGNIQDVCKKATEAMAEDLGDYKILAVAVPSNIVDKFMTKFNWKNTKKTYMLLVDKKLDAELKNSVKEMAAAAADGSDKKDDSKDDSSK